jgi:hypothetical protein
VATIAKLVHKMVGTLSPTIACNGAPSFEYAFYSGNPREQAREIDRLVSRKVASRGFKHRRWEKVTCPECQLKRKEDEV